MNDIYSSPFTSRYSSDYMKELFSETTRIRTWRKLWVSLAKAEKALGLNITDDQIDSLEKNIDNIDLKVAKDREKIVRHDVMAHVYAYGKVAPEAAGIIHLGATSCYVTDNADLILYRDALLYIRNELKLVIKNIADFAYEYKDLPTLGYTHYQSAQLVTVGKRASLWLQDFMSDLDEIDFVISSLKLLGSRGTTGTEASFLELFDGDPEKIDKMNELIAHDFDFTDIYDVSGQTYSRKVDSRIINSLASIAQSAYKMADDIRLLQHDRQLEEPFEKEQIGSSAMAYKRNPMRSERICSLSRYLMNDVMNASQTAAAQWLERTLDDSAIRRISMPEGFLCCDAIIRLCINITDGLNVNEKIITKAVMDNIGFMATENILMEAVKRGGDRQKLHEIIRQESMKCVEKIRSGESYDLIRMLSDTGSFNMSYDEMISIVDPSKFIGRCPEQVEKIVKKAYELAKDSIDQTVNIEV